MDGLGAAKTSQSDQRKQSELLPGPFNKAPLQLHQAPPLVAGIIIEVIEWPRLRKTSVRKSSRWRHPRKKSM